MYRAALLIYFFLMLSTAFSQTVKGRSNAVHMDMSKNKISRTSLSYSHVGLEDANRNRTLEAFEEGVIRFAIKNVSKSPSRRLQVRAYLPEEVPGINLPETIIIDPLPPGKTREVRIPIKTAAELPSSMTVITIEVREEGLYETDQIEINVLTEATADSGNN